MSKRPERSNSSNVKLADKHKKEHVRDVEESKRKR